MALFVYPAQSVTLSGGATEAKQDVMITELEDINTELDSQTTLLTSLDGKDYATQTTLAAQAADVALIEGKDFATQTTLAAQASDIASLEAKDFATQTTLAAQAADIALLEAKDFSTATKQDALAAQLLQDTVDQIDIEILDTSSTAIPGSASLPLQVVASTAADTQKVISVEDIGEYIGLYTGAASSEVLKCILPLGGGEVQVDIPSGTRISLRAIETSAISTGKISINFIG